MTRLRHFLHRLLAPFRSRRAESELAREIGAHLQLLEDAFVAKGMDAVEARLAARRVFGGVELTKERHRDTRSFRWIDESLLDFKLGARMLVKYPGLTIVGGLGMSIAIAIGAVSFTVLYSYTLPPIPLDEGDRLFAIQNWDSEANEEEPRTLHDFVTWRDELTSVETIGAFRTIRRNVVVRGGRAESMTVAEITAAGFSIARVPPLIGRALVEDDERDGAPPAIVIGYDIWRTQFESDAGVVGRTIGLGNAAYTVVGVMPEHFAFPVNHSLWIPLRVNPLNFARRQGPSLKVIARLARGRSKADAASELAMIGQRTAAAFPTTHAHLLPRVVSYTSSYGTIIYGNVGQWQMALIQSMVSLLLVLVGANVAVLVYARTATRRGELAVRSALGASRGRIVAQLFVEALVLSMFAAWIGVALAIYAMTRIDELLATGDGLPFWIERGVSFGTIVYVVGLAVLAAVIAGVVPAIQVTGRRMQSGLRELGGSTGLRLGRTWTALIVVQVALAVAILPPVLFQGWDLMRYVTASPGFPAEEFLSASLTMDAAAPSTQNAAAYDRTFAERFADRQAELARRLTAQPSVQGVTFATTVPGEEPTIWIEIDGLATPRYSEDATGYAVRSGTFGHEVRVGRIDPGYFHAFAVPVVMGRDFTAADAGVGRSVVIVNHAFAQKFLGGRNVVGQRIRYVGRSGDARPADVELGRWFEIVGVVADFPAQAMEPGHASAKVYQPLPPGHQPPITMAIHTRGPAAQVATTLRSVTIALDPSLRLEDVKRLDAALREMQGMIRLGALALTLVVVSVLLLSAAGIYSMMSFTVAQRRKEIGIRAALGADGRRILRDIFARALGQLGIGVTIGVVMAVLLDALSGGELTGGSRSILLPAVSLLMLGVGAIAAVGPALRGLRVQPIEVLREE